MFIVEIGYAYILGEQNYENDEQRFRQMLQVVYSSIWRTSGDGQTVYVQDIVKLKIEAIIGKN